jgi:RNA polymerase sigma-70 factor (ECF subfamily)
LSSIPVAAPISAPALTDDELIEQARKGNSEAFSRLFDQHRIYCLRVAQTILRNEADAEEEVQNAFLNAYLGLANLTNNIVFRAWLRRIVVNCCLMRIRQTPKNISLEDVVQLDAMMPVFDSHSAHHMLTPEEQYQREEKRQLLARNLKCIPKIFGQAISMYTLEDLNIDTLAQRLDISPAAAKSRLARARGVLRIKLVEIKGELAA